MNKPRGFTLLELLVVVAVIAVLAGLAVLAFRGASERANDADRVSTLQRTVIAFADAYSKGAALCSVDGAQPCAVGTPLSECRIYKTACTGDSSEDVTRSYIDMREVRDPLWSAPCTADRRLDCDFAMVEYTSLADYEIGFSTEGGKVEGLSLGRSHAITQNGELK